MSLNTLSHLEIFDLTAVLEAVEAAIPAVPDPAHALVLASFAAVLRDDVSVLASP